VSEAARSLYARSLILDCNSSPPLPERLPLSQADLDLARGSGIAVIKLSLGGPSPSGAPRATALARAARLALFSDATD
jgi:hypothetical protein